MKTTHPIAGGRFSVEAYEYGAGEPLLYLHGAGGLLGFEPFLEELGKDFRVIAPHLPGFGESTGGELIEDVIDAALFYHQLMDDLEIPSAHIVGHSMGGMLAAEVAALDTRRAKRLVLVGAAGFWIDAHPIPDVFATDLSELGGYLFHDPASPFAKMFLTVPEDLQQLADMYVERVKRFSSASKFLWPIPDRGLKKRAYRISAPTLLVWGESDRLVPPVYADEFTSRIRNTRIEMIKQAGHMLPYEQPEAFVKAVRKFLES
ncbi:MAG TPA: alpha/beta hydrolase [Candidatus Binataceae bacterium]|nr:alpha/beta hydrolase [Candidatus Binataceae bacterium]